MKKPRISSHLLAMGMAIGYTLLLLVLGGMGVDTDTLIVLMMLFFTIGMSIVPSFMKPS